MIELITLGSTSYSEEGYLIDFQLNYSTQLTSQDFEQVLMWTTNQGEVDITDSVLINRGFIQPDTNSDTWVNLYKKKLTKEDIIVFKVFVKESAIQKILTQNGIIDCTRTYIPLVVSIADLSYLRRDALKLYFKESCCDCSFPTAFLDQILKIEAIEAAIKLGDTASLEKIQWTCTPIRKCKCNG